MSSDSCSNVQPSGFCSVNVSTLDSMVVDCGVDSSSSKGEGIFTLGPLRFNERLIVPQFLCCAESTPATRINNVCRFPERGSSNALQRECKSSLDNFSSLSSLSCFGSWFKWRYKRCLRVLREPVFLIPNTPSKSPRSVLRIVRSPSIVRSQSERIKSRMSWARRNSTDPFFAKP